MGGLVLHEYEQFGRTLRSLQNTYELFEELPPRTEIEPKVCRGAEIIAAKRNVPAEPIRCIETHVQNATRLRCFTPVVLPQYIELFHEQLVDADLTGELLFEEAAATHVRKRYRDQLDEALATRSLTLLQTTTELPFGLIVIEKPNPEMIVVVYTPEGNVRGVILNDSAEANRWAEFTYRKYRDEGTPIDM